ncbi:galactonate dehydratase [Curtobacterium sp. 22159]|uniref:galactonate dehydratase n=1 Tax=Curtobacterium sp. 22159 TaxID=3453882 RepID=UPI003F873A57
MRITTVETFVLSNRRALVRIGTDEGVAGWGEPVLENWARTTAAAVDRLAEHLVGTDPLRITHLWQVMARGGFYRGGAVLASAVAGVDQALWDLKGRWLGVPVHELLGGATRDRVRVYAHASAEDRFGSPDRARRLVADGFTMVKCAPPGRLDPIDRPAGLEQAVRELEELRDAVGPEVDVAIDLHGRSSMANSRRLLARLDDVAPVFVEEPLRPEHSARIGDVVRSTTIPIAVGERLYSREEFRPVLEQGIAVAQPDLSHAGGITECFRIGTMAESYDVLVAPHCPLGPVALAACLQLDLALPNVLAQEMVVTPEYGTGTGIELVRNPEVLAVRDGFVERLTGPGLGIEVDEDAVRDAVDTGVLAPGSPVWSAPDGSFAEW